MITRLKIENYRSIKSVDIPLGELNAFIGYNNAGKSNILSAIDILLGEKWPTNPFRLEDFYNHDIRNHITIEVHFSQPLNSNSECQGFRIFDDGINRPELRALNSAGNVCTIGSPYLNRFMKDECSAVFLDLNRMTNKQLNPTEWTMFGKLLRYVESQMNSTQVDSFKQSMDQGYNTHLEPILRTQFEKIKDYTKKHTGLDLDFEFKTFDPLYILKNVKPYIKESSRLMDLDNSGAGIQSAITLAIARTYAEYVRTPITIIIEEPELYLHPHACRHFYQILKDMSSSNLQILYSTHERCFVNMEDYKNIRLVKKENDETKVYNVSSLSTSPSEELRLISKCDEMMNEMFFAEAAIVVEGYDDKLACRLALEKENYDADINNVSIIEAGGKNEIHYICEILHKFNIKTIAVYDADAQVEINQTTALLGASNVFLQSPRDLEGMLGYPAGTHFNKRTALTTLPTWFSTNPTPSIYTDIMRIL